MFKFHTHKRTDNDDKVEYVPGLLEVMRPQCNNLDYSF